MRMLSVYDMVRPLLGNAQASRAMPGLFGLSPPQANRAVEALMPAFALGLERAARDPQVLMHLMALVNRVSASMPNPFTTALEPDASGNADQALALLFGKSEARAAIARQAAELSGAPPDKVVELMPAVTSAVLTGLQKDNPVQAGPMGEMIAAFVAGFERGRPDPDARPRLDLSPEAAGDILNAFFAGFQRGEQPGPDRAPEDDPEPPAGDAAANGEEQDAAFADLFKAGDEIHKAHVEAMRGLFATLYGTGRP